MVLGDLILMTSESFELDAIGIAGEEHRYEVADEALRAYAAATDDVPGGPVFAIVPVWETIGPASRSVASDEARKRVVHYSTTSSPIGRSRRG